MGVGTGGGGGGGGRLLPSLHALRLRRQTVDVKLLLVTQAITPLQNVYLAFTNFGKGTNDLIYDMDMKAFAKVCPLQR